MPASKSSCYAGDERWRRFQRGFLPREQLPGAIIRAGSLSLVLAIAGFSVPAGGTQGVVITGTITEYSGTCERLLVAGADWARSCGGAATEFRNVVLRGDHPSFRDGRSSFGFKVGTIDLSFIGSGGPVRPGVNSRLVVTQVAYGGEMAATGSCQFANARGGRVTARCTARTDQGEYSASFTSNGQAPEIFAE